MNFNINPFVRYVAKSRHIINKKYVIARDCRLLYVVSGLGTFECNNLAYTLVPNTLIYYPYDIPYRITSEKENGMLFYTVNFDFTYDYSDITTMTPQILQKHNPDSVLRSMDINCSIRDVFSNVIHIPDAISLENHIRIIYNEALQKNEGYKDIQSLYLKIILIEIYRNLINNTLNNPLCKKIKELVLKNLNLNNKEIAEQLNYHPFYLNEVFKKNEGITLHKYIMQQRLIKSYELIATTELTLEKIALMCGFSSQAHFSYMFKSAYNITPGRMRHQA